MLQHPSIHSPIHPFIHPSVRPSVRPSVHQSIHPSIIVLHCIALHPSCIALHCIALHCTVLHTCMHACVHACIHTIDTYVCTYMCTLLSVSVQGVATFVSEFSCSSSVVGMSTMSSPVDSCHCTNLPSQIPIPLEPHSRRLKTLWHCHLQPCAFFNEGAGVQTRCLDSHNQASSADV